MILTNARTRSLGVKISPGVRRFDRTSKRDAPIHTYNERVIYTISSDTRPRLTASRLKWFHPERIIRGRKDDRSVAATSDDSIRGIFSPLDENCIFLLNNKQYLLDLFIVVKSLLCTKHHENHYDSQKIQSIYKLNRSAKC